MARRWSSNVINGGRPRDRAADIKSVSKTVLSALTGFAIERGVLRGAGQPILPVLRQDAPADPDLRLARVTIGSALDACRLQPTPAILDPRNPACCMMNDNTVKIERTYS